LSCSESESTDEESDEDPLPSLNELEIKDNTSAPCDENIASGFTKCTQTLTPS